MPGRKKTLPNIDDLQKSIEALQPDRREIAEKLHGRLVFMDKTLDGLQKQIEKEGTTTMFKQGVQEFERESPSLKAYNTTIQRYSLVCKQLVDLLPKAEEKPKTDPLLDFVKAGQQ